MRGAIIAIVILAAAVTTAAADTQEVKSKRPPEWVCALVRQTLAQFGGNRNAAIKAARERGYTSEDIRRARLCL
jgi:hypothetical protein